jgi:hypothetical protein
LVIDVRVTGLQPDLTLLSYDDLFSRESRGGGLNQASAEDAGRIERDSITPLNEELTRRSRQRRRGELRHSSPATSIMQYPDGGRCGTVDVG